MSQNSLDIKKISIADLMQIIKEQREAAEQARQEQAQKNWAEWQDAFAEMRKQREA